MIKPVTQVTHVVPACSGRSLDYVNDRALLTCRVLHGLARTEWGLLQHVS